MIRLAWQTLSDRDPDDLVFLNRVFYPPGFSFPLHAHDFHELAYVLSGSGFHDTPGRSERLDAGMLFAIHPDQQHRCRAGDQPLAFINLVIAPTLAVALGEDLAGMPGWDHAAPPPLLRPGGRDLEALLDHLAGLERQGGTADRLEALALLTDLVWRFRRTGVMPSPRLPDALRRLQESWNDPDLLAGGASALAEQVGCSREHLTRLARRHFGKPLAVLVAERRLDHAARLLRHGNTDVTAICHASGHGNLGHFHAIFRRRFGCTPQQYRQLAPTGPA